MQLKSLNRFFKKKKKKIFTQSLTSFSGNISTWQKDRKKKVARGEGGGSVYQYFSSLIVSVSILSLANTIGDICAVNDAFAKIKMISDRVSALLKLTTRRCTCWVHRNSQTRTKKTSLRITHTFLLLFQNNSHTHTLECRHIMSFLLGPQDPPCWPYLFSCIATLKPFPFDISMHFIIANFCNWT